MELKEYLQILKKNLKLFLFFPASLVLVSLLYFYIFRPVSYDTSISLNISRSGSQDTSEYKYDDFYRLQADEKFAETITQWMRDPRVTEDIYLGAGVNTVKMSIRQLSKSLRAEKLSSQLVSVKFSSMDIKTSEKISQSLEKTISQNTENLNKNQKESTWFEIVFGEPVVRKYDPGILISFFAPLVLGLFLGVWGVLVKHYLGA